jgi:hypothetical protein
MKNYQKMPVIGYCYLKENSKEQKFPIVEIITNNNGKFYVTNAKHQNIPLVLPKDIVENFVTIKEYQKNIIGNMIKEELGRITGLPVFRLGHPMTLQYEDQLYQNEDEYNDLIAKEAEEKKEEIKEQKYPDVTNFKLTELYKRYKHLKYK